MKTGDFFAIDFLRIRNNISFSLIIGHSGKLQDSLDMQISFDGVWWISHQLLRSTFIEIRRTPSRNFHRIVIDAKQFSLGLQSFRYVSFNATRNLTDAFQVCDIQLINNLHINVK